MGVVNPGEMRVGDAERREVDARLQQAHGEGRLSLQEYEERSALAWAARTRGDLEKLTSDLPVAAPLPVHEPQPARAPARRVEGVLQKAGNAVLGIAAVGLLIWGGTQVAAVDGAIFGETTVYVTPGQDRYEVGALFGHTQVIVPEGVRATQSGGMIFGSAECQLACANDGAQVVEIDSRGAFGQVEIMTPQEFANGGIDEDADDDDD
jgi:hypothetical protein